MNLNLAAPASAPSRGIDIEVGQGLLGLGCDRSEVERFICALTSNPSAPSIERLCWVWFPDDKTKRTSSGSVFGTLYEVWDRLVAANADGNGIFVVVSVSGSSRKDEDVTGLRAAFLPDPGASEHFGA